MNLKNMLGAASLNKEEKKSFIPMVTPWGENLDRKNILSEYPRPQMRRKNYVMLNGIWEYRILTGKEGKMQKPGWNLFRTERSLCRFRRKAICPV